jgi:hypothetical protein
MIQYRFSVCLPVSINSENRPCFFMVSKFNFDPGLEEHAEVTLNDVSLHRLLVDGKEVTTVGPTFSFKAAVTGKQYLVIQEVNNDEVRDIFVVNYMLEIADKEDIPRMVKEVRRYNPTYSECTLDDFKG